MRTHTICLALAIVLICPYASAQWVRTNGPNGCTVRTIAGSGSNLFVGTDRCFIYRSSDNGTSWTHASQMSTGGLSLAVSGSTLFAGTYGAGVFRSTDNGVSWTGISTGLSDGEVNCLAIRGTDLFAATGVGVFRLTNNGTSWTEVNTGLTDTYVLALAVSGTNLFAGTLGGRVFRSTNNGDSWTSASSGLPDASVLTLMASGPTLYAGTQGSGVYRSANNGDSWMPVNQGLPTDANVLALSSIDTIIYAGATSVDSSGVFRSANNGETWTAASQGLTSPVVHALFASGTTLFAGTDYGDDVGGVYRSTNYGDIWMEANQGLVETLVSELAGNGEAVLSRIYRYIVMCSTNNGESWNRITFGGNDGDNTGFGVAATTGHLFVCSPNGVYRSSDNGQTWVGANNGLDVTVGALAAVGQKLYAWGYDGYYSNNGRIFESINNGDTWRRLEWPDSLGASSITVCRNNLFATAFSGYFKHSVGHGVFRSTDNGVRWVQVNQGLPDSGAGRIVTVGTTLFVTSLHGVYRSTNNGESWTNANEGLPDSSFVLSFLVSGTNLFAATYKYGSSGSPIFCLADGANSWRDVSEGLPGFTIFALASNGTHLFAGTDRAGAWRRPLSEMITAVGPVTSELPREFALSQNYPNPFNPSTTIKYELPTSSIVKLSVFDILGREVSVLVNERRDAGVHEVKFDGSTLASGVYLYRLTAGSFVETRKLVLVR